MPLFRPAKPSGRTLSGKEGGEVKIIYEPKGAALEYAPLAANLYSGCVHGCRYCFVPGVMRKTRETFHAKAEPRKDVIRLFEDDCMTLAGGGRRSGNPSVLCDGPLPAGRVEPENNPYGNNDSQGL